MTNETKTNEQQAPKPKTVYRGHASDAVYGFGMIGAWIYFIGQAGTFWVGVLGFLKGIVWPVLLVYEALKFFQM